MAITLCEYRGSAYISVITCLFVVASSFAPTSLASSTFGTQGVLLSQYIRPQPDPRFGSTIPVYQARTARVQPGHLAKGRRDEQGTPLNSNSDAPGVVPTIGNHEFAYLAQIQIGGQDLLVTLDTGSSDLWVASNGCTSDICRNIKLYNNSTSLSVTNSDFSLNYIYGSVKGNVAYETVHIGKYMISTQVFALVNNVTLLPLADSGASGILGLSLPGPASIPRRNGPTLVENILNALPDANKVFGFGAGRGLAPGSFTIGAIDATIALNSTALQYIPIHANDDGTYDYWKIPLVSISVNNHTIALSRTTSVGNSPANLPIAVLDTGTTLMLGPQEDVDTIYSFSQTARQKPDGNHNWELDCTEVMELKLEFAVSLGSTTREYWIHPLDMSWDGSQSGDRVWCLGGLQANQDISSGDWLLGDTVLRNIYVAHYLATQALPPTLGLLNLTDRQAAADSFLNVRGPPMFNTSETKSVPSSGPTDSKSKQTLHGRTSGEKSNKVLIVLVTLLGFFLGMGTVMYIKLKREGRDWPNKYVQERQDAKRM